MENNKTSIEFQQATVAELRKLRLQVKLTMIENKKTIKELKKLNKIYF